MAAGRRLEFTAILPSGHPRERRLADRFDHDQLSQLLADSQPRVADLADEIALAGDQPDDLIFAEANVPQPLLNFRRSAQLLDAHRHACLYAIQWTDFAASFALVCRLEHLFCTHLSVISLGSGPPAHYTEFVFPRTLIARSQQGCFDLHQSDL